jgi:hypothetical protein
MIAQVEISIKNWTKSKECHNKTLNIVITVVKSRWLCRIHFPKVSKQRKIKYEFRENAAAQKFESSVLRIGKLLKCIYHNKPKYSSTLQGWSVTFILSSSRYSCRISHATLCIFYVCFFSIRRFLRGSISILVYKRKCIILDLPMFITHKDLQK